MSWVYLILAGLLEVCWAIGLKYSDGFTRLMPSIFTAATFTASVVLLGLAVRDLPIGTAYAVWSAVGTVGTVILGIVLLGDAATLFRLACIAVVIAGTIGLKFAD